MTKKARKSHYGHLIPEADAPVETEVTTYENTTTYGGKRWRTGYAGDTFAHPTGTKPKAVILDIDGTLEDWGSSTASAGMEFAKKHHDQDHVLIVATARDHEWMYHTSFNWLMKHLPYPFIGPFMRSKDDPRTAGEFKRELALSLEAIYEIVGAIDDNNYVCDMWDEFAKDRPGFESVRCGYSKYSDWRKDLPAKSYGGSYGWGSSTSSYVGGHPGETWISGHYDKAAKEWINGHWEKDVEPKHRQAGQRSFADVSQSDEAPTEAAEDAYRMELEDIVAHAYPTVTPEEMAAMSISELAEQAGFFGDATPEDPMTREGRVQWRLDTEEDVYAEYGTLTRAEIEAMDMVWLEKLWDFALSGRPTEAALADYAEVARQTLCDTGEETAPLDVEEILGEIVDSTDTEEVA